MPTRLGMAVNGTQREFLKSLAVDIRPLGHDLHYNEKKHRNQKLGWLEGGLRGDSRDSHTESSEESEDSPASRLHGRLRLLECDPQDRGFQALEGNFKNWASQGPGTIRLADIQPALQVEALSPTDERLVYARLLQSIRSSPGVGRQIVGVVRDQGHSGSPVMGVIAVGQPQYFQGERDFFLGWANPQLVTRAARTRESGLPHIGQLSLFVAVPPYDRLGVVRMLPPIVFTTEFGRTFKKDRCKELAGVVCTAALGEHVPALRKHRIENLTASPRRTGRASSLVNSEHSELYRRLSGLQRKRTRVLELASSETRRLAAALSKTVRTDEPQSKRMPQWQRDVCTALRLVALPLTLFDANFVATYYGSVSKEQDNALRLGIEPPPVQKLSFQKIAGAWRDFAVSRYKIDAVVETTNPETLLVSYRITRQRERAGLKL